MFKPYAAMHHPTCIKVIHQTTILDLGIGKMGNQVKFDVFPTNKLVLRFLDEIKPYRLQLHKHLCLPHKNIPTAANVL